MTDNSKKDKKPGVAEEFQEVEFFIEQGLYDDALELLTELKKEKPDLPGLDEKIAEVSPKAKFRPPSSLIPSLPNLPGGMIKPQPTPSSEAPDSGIQSRLQALKAKARAQSTRLKAVDKAREFPIPKDEDKAGIEKPKPADEAPTEEFEPKADAEAEVSDERAPEDKSTLVWDGKDPRERKGEEQPEDEYEEEEEEEEEDDEEERAARASDKAETLIWDGAKAKEAGLYDEPQSSGNWKFVVGLMLGVIVGVGAYIAYQRYTIVPRKKAPAQAPQDGQSEAPPPSQVHPAPLPDGGLPQPATPPVAVDARAPAPAARAVPDAAVARPVAPTAAQKVTLTVTVKPKWCKASVRFRGVWYRKNFFKSQPMAPKKIKESILIKAPGFYPRKLSFVLNKNVTLETVLMKRPAKPMAPRPRPRPHPRPRPRPR